MEPKSSAATEEEITLVARKAAIVLTQSLFPGKKGDDMVSQEELEAAGLGDVAAGASSAEELKERIAAEGELPEKLVRTFEDAIRGSGRSVEAVFKALEDAHKATDGAPDTEGAIADSLAGTDSGSEAGSADSTGASQQESEGDAVSGSGSETAGQAAAETVEVLLLSVGGCSSQSLMYENWRPS